MQTLPTMSDEEAVDAAPISVSVAEPLRIHLPAAVARLGYLYPNVRFVLAADGVDLHGSDLDLSHLRREVLHAVYRERIFAETLPLRRTLIDGLLA